MYQKVHIEAHFVLFLASAFDMVAVLGTSTTSNVDVSRKKKTYSILLHVSQASKLGIFAWVAVMPTSERF